MRHVIAFALLASFMCGAAVASHGGKRRAERQAEELRASARLVKAPPESDEAIEARYAVEYMMEQEAKRRAALRKVHNGN